MDAVTRGVNAFLMIVLGLALGAFLAHRWKLPWGLFGIGAVIFLLSQLAHIPFNGLLLSRLLDRLGWTDPASAAALLGTAGLLGLSAGVFEEGARYLMYRFWARKSRSWEEALMIGAGHGAMEAVLLGLLAGYALLQALALQGTDLATILPAGQLETARAQLEAYWAAPWYAALLGAVERAFALCLHLSLSVLVLQCFTRRRWFWLPAAVGWHAVADGAAVIAVQRVGPYWTEALVGVMALLSLGLVWILRPPAVESVPAVEVPPGMGPPPPLPELHESPPLQAKRIDDTRFTPSG